MPSLRGLERVQDRAGRSDEFPFSVPAIRTLTELDLSSAVTFFVGENGSGKSTVLEAIAAAARLPTVGSAEVVADATLAVQRQLATIFRLVWTKRTHKGFFLRAEDFFGFVKRLSQQRAEFTEQLARLETEYADRSPYAKGLAQGPIHSSLQDMATRYGVDLDANSHGESFLKLFQSRFVPGGLYLLDEPEAALSPQSQLGLLAMLREMVATDAQFVIATHSPMLLAYPNACIYSFDTLPLARTAYEDLEHVNLMRAFLQDPQRFLRLLD